MSDNDLIRRGDAIAEIELYRSDWSTARDEIATIPASEVAVTPDPAKVQALLAECDALRRENESLRQIDRNVQAVREHEYNRAEAALAEVERMKAERDEAMEGWHVIHPNITVQDAAKVPEIKALIESATIVDDSYWNSTDGVIRGIYDLGVALHNITEGRE